MKLSKFLFMPFICIYLFSLSTGMAQGMAVSFSRTVMKECPTFNHNSSKKLLIAIIQAEQSDENICESEIVQFWLKQCGPQTGCKRIEELYSMSKQEQLGRVVGGQ